jgi:hypothetical protein
MADIHRGDADAAQEVRQDWNATLTANSPDDSRAWWYDWPEPCSWHVNG